MSKTRAHLLLFLNMNPAENYILRQPEPYRSVMLYARAVILRTLDHITEKYNYSVPFYHYKKRPFVYLNILKSQNCVDVAFVKGVRLNDQFPQLQDYNNRKWVRSLQYTSLESIDEKVLIDILHAAAALTDGR